MDTIGLACFSYDFASLDGEESPIISTFGAIEVVQSSSIAIKFFLFMRRFPILLRLPLYGSALTNELHKAAIGVSKKLFRKAKGENKEGNFDEKGDHSVLGMLSMPVLYSLCVLVTFELL